ncbi:hypothetical protein [Longimicrobium sp.]|uniref:hypothetical protein n=1 Tax=Longimicrobium sp. TaxID=2029185 RepID=UPI002E30F3CE|nr:hypothetical protein [Longimicrobium sp.]HEX6039731.1 hypothetical protein [Longimicrobium sp.]
MASRAPDHDARSLLLRLEARRLADPFRHPRVGAWIGVGLPAALGIAALWLGADSVRPDPQDGDGAIGLGLLISAPIAFWAYPILFRPGDDALLRRLGIPARASYGLRATRLAALALLVVLLALVPYAATGTLGALPVALVLAAALTGWGMSLSALSGAAERVALPGRGLELTSRMMGPDPELARAGPLVWAPLKPVIVAALATRMVLVPALPAFAWVAGFTVAAALLAMLGARRFERAAPRFGPQAAEMAYAPPPDAGDAGLVIGRGLAAVLPSRAGAVRARDAAVVGRRFRWAGRVAWPVSLVCVLALLRAGERTEVQGWVAFAGALVLAMQAMAVIGLGRMERGGMRWLDRAAGLGAADRLLGRWAAAFGMALALVVPVGMVWGLIVPGSTGWLWPAAAAGSAAVASAASLAAAGR